MADLGTAYVQIIPKAEGISGKISEALGGESKAAGEQAGSVFSKLFSSKVAKGAAIAGGAIAAGLGIGAVALKKGIQQTAEYGDHVDKMSQKIGFSAEEYQKWDYVLQRAGTSVDSMAPAMKKLSTAATENSAAFQELGLSQEQVASMSQGELFSATISKLSEMENQTERTALASKLLGKGATELGPLLNGGTKAIDEQMKIAEKYGMVMSDEAVKASAEFQDSLTTMGMTMTGLKNRMMSEFLPAATKVTDGLAKMFTGDMSGLDDVVDGIKGIASKCAEMAPKLLKAGADLIGQLISGLLQKADGIGETAGSLIGSLVSKIIEFVPKILAAAGKLALGIAKGLIKAAPTILSSISKIVSKMLKWFLKGGWKDVGTKMLTLVVKGVKGATSKLLSLVKTVVSKILEHFGFSGLKEKVSETFENAKTAVQEKVDEIKGKVEDMVQKIKKFFPIKLGKIFSGWFNKISLKFNRSEDGGNTTSTKTTEYLGKAMNKPYVFKRPTNFMAGEAGDEVLFGRKALLHDIREASGGKSITLNVTNNISGSEDPELFADRLTRRLELNLRSI